MENKFLALWFITTTKLPEIRYYQSLCHTSFDKKRYLQNKNKTVLWSVAFPFHHILLLTKKFPHFCIPPLSFYFSSIAAKFTLQFLESCQELQKEGKKEGGRGYDERGQGCRMGGGHRIEGRGGTEWEWRCQELISNSPSSLFLRSQSIRFSKSNRKVSILLLLLLWLPLYSKAINPERAKSGNNK